MKKLIRQGDVMLEPVSSIPIDIKKKDEILAYGEVTGHKHRLFGGQFQVFKDQENTQFVQIQEETELVHEEHDTLQIPKGVYKVVMQREFDIVEGIRKVMD